MRHEILTLRDVWLSGYQRLLDEATAAGRLEIRGSAAERRGHPRFKVCGGNVIVPGLQVLRVQDLSAGGVALVSAVPAQAGSRLEVSLANAFSTDVGVVACGLTKGDAAPAAPAYLVRGRFVDADHGLQFVTLALELERIERD